MTTTPAPSGMLAGMSTDDLLALQAALEEKLIEEREKIEALASSLGGSCTFKNGPHRKKGKRPNAKHDDA